MQTNPTAQLNREGLVGETEKVYSSPFTRPWRAWLIFAVVTTFVLLQFALQLTSGEIVGGLMQSFALSAFGAGVLSSSYYYIYVLMQTPAGIIMDSVGPRKALSIGAVICAFGCAVFAFAPNTFIALLGRILMGGGTSCAFVGALYVALNWFPSRLFGLLVGIVEGGGMVASMIGGVLVASAVKHVGWRGITFAFAALILLVGALIVWLVKDKPKRQTMVVESAPEHHFWQEFLSFLKRPVAWLNGLYIGFIFSFVTVFAALWGVPFLRLAHGWSLVQATTVADTIFLGVAVGGPIIGWIDNHIKERRGFMAGAAILSALLSVLVIMLPGLPTAVVVALTFLVGMASSAYVVSFTVASEIATPLVRSTSVGFANSLGVLSAPVFQSLIGLIMHHVSPVIAGKEVYTVHAYQVALLLLPAFALLAGVMAWFIPSRPVESEVSISSSL